jgi:hypothetical protein
MKLIAVATENEDQGQFVFTSLQEAVAKGRMSLADVAFAYRDPRGDLSLSHTKGRLSRLFGSGIDDDRVRQVVEAAPEGAYVFALGEEEAVDAVARRVNTVTKGSMKTYAVRSDGLSEITEQDTTYELRGDNAALLEQSEAIEQPDTLIHKGIFS